MITVSKAKMLNGIIDLEVDYTTAKQVNGLNGLGNVQQLNLVRSVHLKRFWSL